MTKRLVGEVAMGRQDLTTVLAALAAKIETSRAESFDVRLCQNGGAAELVFFETGTEDLIAKVNCGGIKV